MGQSNARQRLEIINENVDEISEKIKADELSTDDRNRSHDILLEYIKELKFILSRSVRASRIRKVERRIVAALQELATLEGTLNNVEPRMKAKSLQTLNDIELSMKTISVALTNQNFETEREAINVHKNRLSLIDDIDQEVGVKKNKVLDVVNRVESTFTQLEIEEKLKQAERKHYQCRLDLTRFMGVSDSNCYKTHKEHLLNLKTEISKVSEVSDQVSDRKKYLLFNINNNLAALDKKARENEENIKKQLVQEEVYSETTPIRLNENLLEQVVNSYADFEKLFSANCAFEELQEIFRQLTDLKIKIDQKVKVLENQIQIQDVDPYIEWVPVKEKFVEDSVSMNKIKEIQNAVKELQEDIARSKYTKESHVYKNCKKKLEDYRNEVETHQEDQELSNCVLKYINDVLVVLEENSSDRNSITGDLLIDIMSISTNVNELGNNIKGSKNTTQDYHSIERDLLEQLHYLKKLEVPPERSNICKFRDYVEIQIDSHLSNLDKTKKRMHTLEIFKPANEEMLSI